MIGRVLLILRLFAIPKLPPAHSLDPPIKLVEQVHRRRPQASPIPSPLGSVGSVGRHAGTIAHGAVGHWYSGCAHGVVVLVAEFTVQVITLEPYAWRQHAGPNERTYGSAAIAHGGRWIAADVGLLLRPLDEAAG